MKRFLVHILCCFIIIKKYRHYVRDKLLHKENIEYCKTISNDSPLLTTYMSKVFQDDYDLSKERQSKKLIVFIEPRFSNKTGGAVGRYTYYKNLKKIIDDQTSIVYTTEPGPFTYSKNDFFDNDIKYLRWEQVRDLMNGKEEVMLFIPMLELQHPYTKKETFRDNLIGEDYKTFKSIKKLRVHINNGRMDMMPEKRIYSWFRSFTDDITTSVMHVSSNTQEICNQIETPLIYLPARMDSTYNRKIAFSKKEKLIIISPDVLFTNIEFKRKFIIKINKELPEYKVAVVYGKKFEEYRCLQSIASAVISFGEGWDAYFLSSFCLGTVGIAVYNEMFFPNKNNVDSVVLYESYDDLYNNFVDRFKEMMNDEDYYYNIIEKSINNFISKPYDKDLYLNNLRRVVEGDYDFYPEKGFEL